MNDLYFWFAYFVAWTCVIIVMIDPSPWSSPHE